MESKKIWESYEETVELPSGVTAHYENFTLTLKGAKGEVSKVLKYPHISFKIEGNNVVIFTQRYTKRQKKVIHTFRAHVSNLATGVSEGFEYVLKVVFSKFPMTVQVSGQQLTVKNLLGEKVPRIVTFPQDVTVKANGDTITVLGIDKEKTGQVAASIEQSCRITHLDRRVIQDGIFITSKPHRDYV